jgi:hypothetical protein
MPTTWVLVVFVIAGGHPLGTAKSVPGFASWEDCQDAGRAVQPAQGNLNVDIRFRCVEGPKKSD